MGRLWSLLFLSVPILGTAVIVMAAVSNTAPFVDHWLPEDASANGHVIDHLFTFILVLTGLVFIGTGLVLFWVLWKHDRDRSTEPVTYSTGSHTLEVVWSILPAGTLLFIAIFQMDAWAGAKMRRPVLPGPDGRIGTSDDVPKPPLAVVVGRQFEWRIRYAGKDGRLFTPDDVHVVNELHVPVGEEIVLQIESQDVLHSFFLPNLRLKQDLVPGMRQLVWFKAIKEGTFDIVCAELCGWGHYKMRGRLVVESREKFQQWMVDTYVEQERTSIKPSEGEEE